MNKRTVNILLDIDGVVCQYDFPQIFKEHFGLDIPEKMLYTYDLSDCLGIAPQAIEQMFREESHKAPTFIPGALQTLQGLAHDGHHITIWSNRVKYLGAEGLEKWLGVHGIPHADMMHTTPKCHWHVHINDCPAKLAEMRGATDLKILFSQRWNTKCNDVLRQFTRVINWAQVRSELDGLRTI